MSTGADKSSRLRFNIAAEFIKISSDGCQVYTLRCLAIRRLVNLGCFVEEPDTKVGELHDAGRHG